MKASKMAVSTLSALALIMAAGSALAAPTASPLTVAGGTINFHGEVTEAACTVNSTSTDQNIDLGSVKAADLTKGASSKSTAFKIVLEDCAVDSYSTASFDFNGQTAAGDSTALANVAGAGAATGVGVQLTDMDGKIVTINNTTGSGAKMKLAAGTNTASFSAAMFGIADATTGHVQSSTNFSVHYE